MTLVMVQFKIKDYATWERGFNATKEMRSAGGLMNTRAYRSADDPNEIIVQSETNDPAKAKQFLSSPETRSAMEKGGVIGPPTVNFLNPV